MNDKPLDQLLKNAFSVNEEPSSDFASSLVPARISVRAPRWGSRRNAALGLGIVLLGAASAGVYVHLQSAFVAFDFPGYGHLELSGLGGLVSIYSPDGRLLGRTGSPDPAGRRTVVRLGNTTQVVEGVGFHQIVSDGKARFLLDFEAGSDSGRYDASVRPAPKFRAEESAFNAIPGAGVAGLPGMVIGHDSILNLSWRVEGPVKVRFSVRGQTLEAASNWPESATIPRPVPEITWKVGRLAFRAKGFGSHNLVDGKAKTLATLEVEALTP